MHSGFGFPNSAKIKHSKNNVIKIYFSEGKKNVCMAPICNDPLGGRARGPDSVRGVRTLGGGPPAR